MAPSASDSISIQTPRLGMIFRAEPILALELLGDEEGAERTRELRHDGALDAGYEMKEPCGVIIGISARKMSCDFSEPKVLLSERDAHLERRFVRAHVFARLVDGALGFTDFEAVDAELELLVRVIRNRRELLEQLLEAVLEEPFERIPLVAYQVRELDARRAVRAEGLFCHERFGGAHGRRMVTRLGVREACRIRPSL